MSAISRPRPATRRPPDRCGSTRPAPSTRAWSRSRSARAPSRGPVYLHVSAGHRRHRHPRLQRITPGSRGRARTRPSAAAAAGRSPPSRARRGTRPPAPPLPSRSRATSGPGDSSDLDALGMTRSGHAANTLATSAGVAPCVPTPGARNRQDAAARSSSGSMCVGPITAPAGPSRPGASRELSAAMSASNCCSTVCGWRRVARHAGQRGLDRAAFRIRGSRHHQHAAARLGRAGHVAGHGAGAEVGVHGDGVGRERRALAEVRLRVRVVR